MYRLAARLGFADPTELDKLPKKVLNRWEALSVIDDWAGVREKLLWYHIYMMLAVCAGKAELKKEYELLTPQDVFGIQKKKRGRFLTPRQIAEGFARRG